MLGLVEGKVLPGGYGPLFVRDRTGPLPVRRRKLDILRPALGEGLYHVALGALDVGQVLTLVPGVDRQLRNMTL